MLARFRIVVARAIALLVAIETLAGLLPQASGGMQRGVRLVVSRVRRITMRVRAMHVHAYIDAGHVEHREDAHRHAELLEHRVHAARRFAFERQPQRLARVPLHHPVADEAVTHSGEHGRLAQRLGELHRRADRLGGTLPCRAPLRAAASRWRARRSAGRSRPPARLLDAAISSTSSVEVLVASSAPSFATRSTSPMILLLEIHALEHGLDDHVAAGEIGVVDGSFDEARGGAPSRPRRCGRA